MSERVRSGEREKKLRGGEREGEREGVRERGRSENKGKWRTLWNPIHSISG